MEIKDSSSEVLTRDQFTYNAKRLVVIGHRGGKYDLDNTMSGFHKAVENGIKIVEFDICMTKDNVPILIHGGDHGEVEHDCTGAGISSSDKICDLTLEQIRQITLPNGEHIPTFQEFLNEFKDKLDLILDLKEYRPEVIQLIIDALKENEISLAKGSRFQIFSSIWKQIDLFEQLTYESGLRSKTGEHEFQMRIGYIIDNIVGMTAEEYCSKGDIVMVDSQQCTKEIVDNLHNCGKEIMIYYWPSENETTEMYTKLISFGVDFMLSDHPDELRNYIQKSIE